MNVVWLKAWKRRVFPRVFSVALCCLVAIASLVSFPNSAWAGLEDDRYDGDIFALYAGNGSLVPPRVKLATPLKEGKPVLLVFYTDDSRDSKEFATTVSRLQAPYGRVIDILAVRVDALPIKDKFEPTEEGYYYKGFVPQTVVFDQSGKVVLNETGIIPYEKVDDVFRNVFDLLPRSESVPLKRRLVNEVNTELVKE
jgi:hypothetical protein